MVSVVCYCVSSQENEMRLSVIAHQMMVGFASNSRASKSVQLISGILSQAFQSVFIFFFSSYHMSGESFSFFEGKET